MEFAQRLNSLMEKRSLTNYQLAKDLDVHPTTIANWRQGMLPRKKTLLQLSKYFGVTVAYLEGKDQKEKPVTENGDEPDELDKEIMKVFASLTPANKKAALAVLLSLAESQE